MILICEFMSFLFPSSPGEFLPGLAPKFHPQGGPLSGGQCHEALDPGGQPQHARHLVWESQFPELQRLFRTGDIQTRRLFCQTVLQMTLHATLLRFFFVITSLVICTVQYACTYIQCHGYYVYLVYPVTVQEMDRGVLWLDHCNTSCTIHL